MKKAEDAEVSWEQEEAKEEEIRESADHVRCHNCGKVFFRTQTELRISGSVGYYFCFDCINKLEKEGTLEKAE